MLNRLFNSLKSRLYSFKNRPIEILRNINYNPLDDKQKRALICYICNLYSSDINKPIYRTQPYEIAVLVKLFIERGFAVDIVNCLSINMIPKLMNTKYDVIFGFGDVFYEISKNTKNAITCFYLTENPCYFARGQEKARIEYLYKRKRIKYPFSRNEIFYKDKHFELNYDYVIALGETYLLERYQFRNVYKVFPTGLFNKNYSFSLLEKTEHTKSFIWFGSNGAIHKGLDILYDVFANHPDWTLHVCGLHQSEEKYIGNPHGNIINEGLVEVNSNSFINLCNKSAYVISLSCSEGCSTGVCTCMRHGMIPVVLKNVGFNGLEKSIFLNDYNIDYVDREICNIVEIDIDLLNQKRIEAFNWANYTLTLKNFKNSFDKIFNTIIG